MFMQVALGAIGVGVVLMIGYLVISKVKTALPTDDLDAETQQGINNSQSVVYAGFSLVAVGIIVLAAYGIINLFR